MDRRPISGARAATRRLRRLCAAVFAVTLAFAAPVFAGEPPHRVVSMNVWTDQLSMLLAKPEH